MYACHPRWVTNTDHAAALECVRRGILLLPFVLTLVSAQEPAFKAGVSLVEIDAEVIGEGAVIEGLQAADFVVNDDGQRVVIRYCVSEQTALDLVLIFDLSKVMAPQITQLTVAAEMAMAELREGDRVAVLSFDERPQVELPLTGDLREVRRRTRIGLAGAKFGNGFPSVLSAATAAAIYLSGQPGDRRRRAILMFTADIGNGKRESHIATAKTFWNSDTLLSAMVIPSRLSRFTHDDNPLHFEDLQRLGYAFKFSPFDSIDQLAALTGGEVVYSGNTGNARRDLTPNATLREVVEHMRHRYKLYYDRPPGKPGQTRQVEVGLSPTAEALHPSARVVARKGYVIPKQEVP
jgi:VWFA-related protein